MRVTDLACDEAIRTGDNSWLKRLKEVESESCKIRLKELYHVYILVTTDLEIDVYAVYKEQKIQTINRQRFKDFLLDPKKHKECMIAFDSGEVEFYIDEKDLAKFNKFFGLKV